MNKIGAKIANDLLFKEPVVVRFLVETQLEMLLIPSSTHLSLNAISTQYDIFPNALAKQTKFHLSNLPDEIESDIKDFVATNYDIELVMRQRMIDWHYMSQDWDILNLECNSVN